jgi:hypothetical protein
MMERGAVKPTGKIDWRRPPLYAAQRRALFECPDINGQVARYGFCEASTKAGKTVGCMAWLAEQACTGEGDGREYWWVAPVYPQAKIAWRRMKRALPKGLIVKSNETDLYHELINGAVMRFRSAEKPDNLYGEDVYACVIDEASRMREEAWHAIRSTLTQTRGPIRAIGNVKGRGNWFYRLSREAEAGKPGMAYQKLTAYDAVAGGVLEKSEIEDAKSVLPDHVFRELYLAEPADDGGNPFGISSIAACAQAADWLSDERTVCIGVDLAKSVDWTVVVGMDKFGGVTGFARWQREKWSVTTDRLEKIIGRTPALIDATGVGDPIVETLQERLPEVRGFIFSSKSKQMLMEGLALAIQSSEVSFPDGPIRAELDLFEYEYTRTGVRYTAPVGYHDDCVMALGLAQELKRQLYPVIGLSTGPTQFTRISPWFGAGGIDDGHYQQEGFGEAS